MPLWMLYIALRYLFVPYETNLAEYHMFEALEYLGPVLQVVLHAAFAALVLGAAWSIQKRRVPWLRVGMVVVLEGAVYGLLLGPLAAEMTRHSLPVLSVMPPTERLVADLVGALGAGIFEEIAFRLILLSVLALLFFRTCEVFSLPRELGCVLAIIASALLFSLFHHWGGDPQAMESWVFLYRTMAGVLLGGLFIARGIGVCVYTHAMYDVFFYLQRT